MYSVITPLHVTGIWVARLSDNPLEYGSIGAGLNLAMYVRAAGRKGPCRIILNGNSVLEEQSRFICNNGGVDITTNTYSPVKLGYGFGLSAALLISHALLVYSYSNRSLMRGLQEAHVLEVKYKTGLGDVLSEYIGGYAIRVKPGPPGIGVAYRIPLKEYISLVVVEMELFETTPSMLSRITSEIYEYGEKLLNEVILKEDLGVFFENARKFTSRIFDYSRVKELLAGIPGIIDYYLKKSALVVWVEREYLSEIREILEKRGVKIHTTTISPIGVTIVHSHESSEKRKPVN